MPSYLRNVRLSTVLARVGLLLVALRVIIGVSDTASLVVVLAVLLAFPPVWALERRRRARS